MLKWPTTPKPHSIMNHTCIGNQEDELRLLEAGPVMRHYEIHQKTESET